MRTNDWLENRLDFIIQNHFPDVDFKNNLFIAFGRRARTRLGSIKKVPKSRFFGPVFSDFETHITINGHMQDAKIPEFVIDAVIAHELVHYTHGFNSPLPQLATHPHQGRIVDHEMINRGLAEILLQEKKWIKKNWINYLKSYMKGKK